MGLADGYSVGELIAFKRRFDLVPALVYAIVSEAGRLHLHGFIACNEGTREAAKPL
jgi:hypothetical protein